jgi:hypothetical protein
MAPEEIDAAFARFVVSLLTGDFGPPADDEWAAELVAAHIVLNNDLISEVAEDVAIGRRPAYDNARAVDEKVLSAFADGVGGLAGLARELDRSAARLAAAMASLDAGRAAQEIDVRVHDSGRLVREGPVAIGKFIEGNATFHLDLHHDQLRALVRPPGEAPLDAVLPPWRDQD